MLAGPILLEQMAEYTGGNFLMKGIKVCSDNKGLIKREAARLGYKNNYPLETLRSDWDVTEEIHERYGGNGEEQATFEWVKGHQDDEEMVIDLPIPAQYNVKADELAEKRNMKHQGGRTDKKTPMLPCTKAMMYLNGMPITGRYIKRVMEAAMLPGLQQYMREKHGWTRKVARDVDWDLIRSGKAASPETEESL